MLPHFLYKAHTSQLPLAKVGDSPIRSREWLDGAMQFSIHIISRILTMGIYIPIIHFYETQARHSFAPGVVHP